MFRRIFSCGGMLLLAAVALFAMPGSGWARGGHGGGGHGGGGFGGHGGFGYGGYHGFGYGGFHSFGYGGFRGFGFGTRVPHDGRADADAHVTRAVDVRGANQDRGVERSPTLLISTD